MTTATTRERDPYAPTYHRDGSVTYWSVYDQVTVRRARAIPDQELAAMPADWRDRAMRNVARVRDVE